MMPLIYARVYHRLSQVRRYQPHGWPWQDKVQEFCLRKIIAGGL